MTSAPLLPSAQTPPRSASAANSPMASAGGAFPLSEQREAELLTHVPTLRSAEELTWFRDQLAAQGETPTAGLYQALLRQSERLK